MKIKGVKPDDDETDDAVKAKVARTTIITKVWYGMIWYGMVWNVWYGIHAIY